MAHLRRDEAGAESLGATDAQMPGEPAGAAGDLFAGDLQRALQTLHVSQQALPLAGQNEAGAARLLEQ